jgi:peptidoglycan/LPS O-acetylase OafA/YrhL
MRMAWLDFFRGIAALIVVAYHFRDGLELPRFSFGYLTVDLFFVLSGIVLGIRYTAAIESGMSFAEFAWHRLRRLYPMAVIVAALVATMNALSVPVGQYMHAWREGALSVLFVTPYPHSLGMEAAFPCDSPMWSLWAELASNVVWFVALRFGRRFTAAVFAVSMLAFIVLAIHEGQFFMGWQGGAKDLLKALLRALAWFGVGYWIALRKPKRIAPPALLVFGLVLFCALFETHVLSDVVSGALVVVTGCALLVAVMDIQPNGVALQRICTALGILSFPLYLIHVPAGRLAYYPIRMGMNTVVAHLLTIATAALLAVLLNEAVVRRLPSRLISVATTTA